MHRGWPTALHVAQPARQLVRQEQVQRIARGDELCERVNQASVDLLAARTPVVEACRAWLRGRENVQQRYLVHVAAYILGLVMRTLRGAGTPRELAATGGLLWWFFAPAAGFIVVLLPPPDPPPDPASSTGC